MNTPLKQVPNALIPGTACFPQLLTPTVTTHYKPYYYFGTMQIVFFTFESWNLLQTLTV